MKWHYIFTLCRKDFLIEFRQRQTILGILLYIASTAFVVYLSVNKPDAITWNALFWIMQLFIVTNAVAKSFMGDSKNRQLYYYAIAHPIHYIFSKIIGNIILVTGLNIINILIYFTLMGNPTLNSGIYFIITLFGGISLSLIFTLLSAIASKAQQQASLLAILGFPIILPLLMLLIRLSKVAFGEIFRENAVIQLFGLLLGLDLVIIIMSFILFPYLWKE